MKPLLVLTAILALNGAAVSAWADPAAGAAPVVTPAAAPAAPAATPADPNKLICKTKIKTGSRFPERTCMTKAQWDELAAKAAAITSNAQTRGYRANSGG